jgi:hypothetical protein
MIKKLMAIGMGAASLALSILPACARHRFYPGGFGGFGGLGGGFGGMPFGGFPFGGCGFAGLPMAFAGAVHTVKVTETFTTFQGAMGPFGW